jgi:hypothetical protein
MCYTEQVTLSISLADYLKALLHDNGLPRGNVIVNLSGRCKGAQYTSASRKVRNEVFETFTRPFALASSSNTSKCTGLVHYPIMEWPSGTKLYSPHNVRYSSADLDLVILKTEIDVSIVHPFQADPH